jgi:hypothetical protein
MNMQIAIKEEEEMDITKELNKHQNPPVLEITNKYRKTLKGQGHGQDFQSAIISIQDQLLQIKEQFLKSKERKIK